MDPLKEFRGIDAPITRIALYKYDIFATKKFSFGTWTSRQHVFFCIEAGGQTGWAENILAVNRPDAVPDEWAACLAELKGRSVTDALAFLREKICLWEDRLTEAAEAALVDLAGKLTGRSARQLLGLGGSGPVWGAYVILSDDAAFVREKARWALEHRRSRYIKVKLFGKPELDREVIRAVREICPRPDTFLLGDVNCGYRNEGEERPVEEIAASLRALYDEGLDACEDPAFLAAEEWVQLQRAVGQLALIPDYPLRPACRSIHRIREEMGGYYNIHPGCTGSILDAAALAGRVRQLGAGLMIGDDSLVGPGCAIWQQLAAWLEADWVEATEKEGESDFYFRAVRSLPTDSRQNPIPVQPETAGFGLVLDESALREQAAAVREIC